MFPAAQRRYYRHHDDKKSRSRGGLTFECYAVNKDNEADESPSSYTKTALSLWNIAGVRKETDRVVSRCIKKISKANTRYKNALNVVETLTSNDYEATLEELEACPNVDAIQRDLEDLRERLKTLQRIQETLQSLKSSGGVVLPPDVATALVDLQVNDAPPTRKPHAKKIKQQQQRPGNEPRRPYRRYYTNDRTEIRVGKQAVDNDELSCNHLHRDADDWWMHASGCPGSHVVIRTHAKVLDNQVLQDAAALAARQSKCRGTNIKVTLTKCRHVTKPVGAKPGLVQLNGKVNIITVNMKQAELRLSRLDETVLV